MILICRFKFSNSVLAGPFPSRRLVSWAVGLVDVSDLGNERIIRVGVCEHRADGEEDYRYMLVSLAIRLYDRRIGYVPLEIVRAGLHWSRRMSRQMLPLELMLGW